MQPHPHQKRDQVSFRLPPGTKQRIEQLAKSTKRSKTFILEDAITHYLDLNEWQLKSISKGLEDIEAGRVTSHDDMIAEWEAKVARSMD